MVVEKLLLTKGQLYKERVQLEASRLTLNHRTAAAPAQGEWAFASADVSLAQVEWAVARPDESPAQGGNVTKLPVASTEGKTGSRSRKRRWKSEKGKEGGTDTTSPVQETEMDFTIVKSKKPKKAKKPVPP